MSFRFSIRYLAVGFFVLSLPIAWYANKRHAYRREWSHLLKATEQLEIHGGHLVYGRVPAPTEGSTWRNLIGDRYLENASGLLCSGECDDSILLAFLSKRFHLTALWLVDCRVTIQGLRQALRAPNLHSLAVKGTSIRNAGEIFLECPQLVSLTLIDTDMAESDVKYLNTMTHLKYLRISDPSFADEHMRQLRQPPRELDLVGSGLTRKSILFLTKHVQLHQLWIDSSQFSLKEAQLISDLLPETYVCYDHNWLDKRLPFELNDGEAAILGAEWTIASQTVTEFNSIRPFGPSFPYKD